MSKMSNLDIDRQNYDIEEEIFKVIQEAEILGIGCDSYRQCLSPKYWEGGWGNNKPNNNEDDTSFIGYDICKNDVSFWK